ncbi:MAG: hypothetical protein E7609_00545 [Ruminococcaceae bacterium]|nr:hypothetical protein [Oscillospiraceae bacterium]
MYIGKHAAPAENEDEHARKPIHIPENYAGNAFSSVQEADSNAVFQEEPKANARHLPMCIEEPSHERTGPFFKLDRLFSSDTLLILLAILLAGSEDGGELAVILLLLLLF